MSGMDLDSPICDFEQLYDPRAVDPCVPVGIAAIPSLALEGHATNDEFKDQDPNNPANFGLDTFGRRCQDAGMTLLRCDDLATVSLRDHPLVMKANVLAWMHSKQNVITATNDRSRDLWATIRLTPRPPPSIVHSLDLAVEGADGTLYVGADNDRRGRKRMRTAYVNGATQCDPTGHGQ
jgi:hypothetical protein